MGVAPSVVPALNRLRDYMHGFYPDREKSDPFPLEFWKIEDDDLFFEALNYLPLMMGVVDEKSLDYLPEGFRLAYAVFSIEDDYQVNGWTALTNAGPEFLPYAVVAYERMGLTTEAAALAAALKSVLADRSDTDGAEAAYKSVENPTADDEVRSVALLRFFRANSHLFEAHA